MTEVAVRSTEPTDSGEHDDLHTLFARITAALSDGDLTFQPPFDLATSAALAANADAGDIAQRLFDVTRVRDTTYLVQITEIAPGVSDREVVNTTVSGAGLLIALLDGLIEEQLARQNSEEGDPSGG
jgi:hypothetical protein